MSLYAFLSLFNPLPHSSYELLQSRLHPVNFKKGEIIVREGQVQKRLYFIKQGLLISYMLHKGQEHVVAFAYAPGLAAAPESFFSQRPSSCFLQSLTDMECDYITYNDLQELFDQSQQIERVFRKLTETILTGLILRYNELQTLSIEERFKSFTHRSPHLLQIAPHKYIASYLNINKTNFSKLYNSIRM